MKPLYLRDYIKNKPSMAQKSAEWLTYLGITLTIMFFVGRLLV